MKMNNYSVIYSKVDFFLFLYSLTSKLADVTHNHHHPHLLRHHRHLLRHPHHRQSTTFPNIGTAAHTIRSLLSWLRLLSLFFAFKCSLFSALQHTLSHWSSILGSLHQATDNITVIAYEECIQWELCVHCIRDNLTSIEMYWHMMREPRLTG